MIQQLDELKTKALQELDKLQDVKELESWRVRYLGKKSFLTSTLRSLATLPVAERKSVGARANQVKTDLENGRQEKEQALREARLVAGTQREIMDITLPGRPLPTGRLHPITQTLNEISDIFASMGFQIFEGPDVEWDYYNFEALNIPAEHPSRDTMSTCWVEPRTESGDYNRLLRTHTTAVTARVIEKMAPPIRGRSTSSPAAFSARRERCVFAAISSPSLSRVLRWPLSAWPATVKGADFAGTAAG
jgi:phenylalanyl-tRNA synthetase alpha chain